MQNIELVRTTAENSDFKALVKQLDADLFDRYGEQQQFFGQFNVTTAIKHVVLAYVDGTPIACGAVKHYSPGTMEVKRMFVATQERGRGIALQVLTELESWAAELGYSNCILETGKGQPEAIRLYEKAGYAVIPNYDQYVGVEMSVCMKKELERENVTK